MISQSFSHHSDIEGISTRVSFYRLQAPTLSGQAEEFVETKKLVVIK